MTVPRHIHQRDRPTGTVPTAPSPTLFCPSHSAHLVPAFTVSVSAMLPIVFWMGRSRRGARPAHVPWTSPSDLQQCDAAEARLAYFKEHIPDEPSRSLSRAGVFSWRSPASLLTSEQPTLLSNEPPISLPRAIPTSRDSSSILGHSFLRRFERFGDLKDAEIVIDVYGERPSASLPRLIPRTLGSSPTSETPSCDGLNDWDTSQILTAPSVRNTRPSTPISPDSSRSSEPPRKLGLMTDVDSAVHVQSHAIDLAPEGHPDEPRFLSSPGNTFQTRSERLGDVEDIDDAIRLRRQTVDLTREGHPEEPGFGFLVNLGGALLRRFERSGDMADLDNAIVARCQAAHLTPQSHVDKATYLGSISLLLHASIRVVWERGRRRHRHPCRRDTPGRRSLPRIIPKTFDFVVSSYKPTLSALLAVGQHLRPASAPSILALSQPAAPGQNPLPGTVAEVAAVKTHVGDLDYCTWTERRP
ncbi:hypothetical protein OF83DRAFT_758388 [Amylostereum chailletii]|nr:hypothetical protein OF83DRAFT_758388 [Amylostereum chailletii]